MARTDLLKDLDTAVKLSREQGAATPMSGLAAQLMRLHGSQGYLERDPATWWSNTGPPSSEPQAWFRLRSGGAASKR